MALKICVIRSSSGGNCTAVWTENSCILIDCGKINTDDLLRELKDIGISPGTVKAMLISHGHGDHIYKNTLKFSSEFNIPIYINRETCDILKKYGRIKGISERLIKYHSDARFDVERFRIQPFRVFHEDPPSEKNYAGCPFGFSVYKKHLDKEYKIGYITDTSRVTQDIIDELADSNVLVIEANHDTEIANEKSPHDKRWPQHLSNHDSGHAIVKIKEKSTDGKLLKQIFLFHISRRHNDPGLPAMQIGKILEENNIKDIDLIETYHDRRTEVFRID